MPKQVKQSFLKRRLNRLLLVLQAVILAAGGLAPLILSGTASAAQITNREVLISTSQASVAANWDFEFSFTSATVQSIIFEFCDSPLGACTKPAGLNVGTTAVSVGSQTGFSPNTAFAEVTLDTGACDTDASTIATQYCVNRTEATAGAGTNASMTLSGITNASVASTFTTVYVRIRLYSTNAFATLIHEGTVAAVMTNQLTVSGRVQERLVFCVGALGDADTEPTSCLTGDGFPTDTTIDIGVIDNSTIVRSPVDAGAGTSADDDYGIAMVNTNAVNGIVVTYFAEAGTGTNQLRNFRVTGATCNATELTFTDQCFVAASNSGETFTAGTERFGMQIACIRTGSPIGTTANLGSVPAGYNGDGTIASTAAGCEDSDTSFKFAWNNTGVAQTLTDSIASTDKVVDDELIKLRFGSTASATTPTGVYNVVSTFIATATF